MFKRVHRLTTVKRKEDVIQYSEHSPHYRESPTACDSGLLLISFLRKKEYLEKLLRKKKKKRKKTSISVKAGCLRYSGSNFARFTTGDFTEAYNSMWKKQGLEDLQNANGDVMSDAYVTSQCKQHIIVRTGHMTLMKWMFQHGHWGCRCGCVHIDELSTHVINLFIGTTNIQYMQECVCKVCKPTHIQHISAQLYDTFCSSK